MKLRYKILWIDDDFQYVERHIAGIEQFLWSYGIEPSIERIEASSETPVQDQVKPHLDDPEIDLLAVDYKLEDQLGNVLIQHIRESKHIYLPVIFYSSNRPALLEEVSKQALDGVYLSGRGQLKEKAIEVISSLLVKEQTVKRARGLLIEGASELDSNLGEIFVGFWGKLSDEERDTITRYANRIIKGRAKSAANRSEKFPVERNTFYEHMADGFTSDSYDAMFRWKVIAKMLRILGVQGDKLDTFLMLFNTDENNPDRYLMDMRNDYAHQTRAELGKDHDDSKCILIRNELRRHTANINALKEV